MRTLPIGSIIGALGGLTFVLINAGAVPGSLFWRIAAALAFVAIVSVSVLRRSEVDREPPKRTALRTYAVCVTAMIVAIPVGAIVIGTVLSRPAAVLPWVVFVVGAHFLPFASAFHLPIFRWLSASLILVSVLGAIAVLATDSTTAAGWTGVAAGFVLLAFSALGPRLRPGEPPH